MERSRRNTWTRQELKQFPLLAELLSEPGRVDRRAFADAIAQDAEQMLELLPKLARSTDAGMRRVAREVAGRLVLRFARTSGSASAGTGKWRSTRWTPGAEVDLESMLDDLLVSRLLGSPIDVDALAARAWCRQRPAVCLVVDTSGSMGLSRLSAAAISTAALAMRAPTDFSVIAVADQALVLKPQGADRPVDAVIDDLFALRSYGWTDLALGLRAARQQLARSPARRKTVILLTDGDANRGMDPTVEARRLDQVHVVVPGTGNQQTRDIASAGRGQVVGFDNLGEAARAISSLLAAEPGGTPARRPNALCNPASPAAAPEDAVPAPPAGTPRRRPAPVSIPHR